MGETCMLHREEVSFKDKPETPPNDVRLQLRIYVRLKRQTVGAAYVCDA